MTFTLVRKLLRDSRWPLLVVCLLLFVFSFIWVGIAKKVTTEIAPFFEVMAAVGGLPKELIEEVVFKGPGKISQAVLGGSDIRFERPNDFLAVELLHPVVIILAALWAVGRSAGAVAGELERGTMELLMSQPVPRNRLILAHLIADAVVIPAIVASLILGTQLGVIANVPFTLDTSAFQKMPANAQVFIKTLKLPESLPVDASGQWAAGLNLIALMFALSGVTMLISACGRNRWRAIGWASLMAVVMFIGNVVGQLWESASVVRPFTVFFYYQPQKIWLHGNWLANLNEAWPGADVPVPMVAVLFAVGAVGYLLALWVFTRRDLPAPL